MVKKILVVIDISNIYYLIKKKYHGRLNYTMLMDKIREQGEIYRAIGYGADREDQARSFRNMLHGLGIETKYKDVMYYLDPDTGIETPKANWDVGISMDVVKILDMVDAVAFVTADGDFQPCIEYIHSRGKMAFVYGCRISKELRDSANLVFNIPAAFVDYLVPLGATDEVSNSAE